MERRTFKELNEFKSILLVAQKYFLTFIIFLTCYGVPYRYSYNCLNKEILLKMEGIWTVKSIVHRKYESEFSAKLKEKIPLILKTFHNQKLKIDKKRIYWLDKIIDPVTNMEQKPILLSSILFWPLRIYHKSFGDELEDVFRGRFAQEIFYSGVRCFDSYFIPGYPINDCDKEYSFPKYILDRLNVYLDGKLELHVGFDYSGYSTLVLEKETPMEKIDEQIINKCNDIYYQVHSQRKENKDFFLDSKSTLNSIKGKWKVFLISQNPYKYSIPYLSKEEEKSLLGNEVIITENEFTYQSESKEYSTYFEEKSCPTHRALIYYGEAYETSLYLSINKPEYTLQTYDKENEYKDSELETYIDSILRDSFIIKKKKGTLQYSGLSDKEKILIIENVCFRSIFDNIFILKKRTMVLRIGRNFLLLHKVKKD